jgi:hypothetical protein
MRTDLNNGREYELEAEYGLPETLPKDERVLWQGSPNHWVIAKEVFFIRVVAAYFLAIILYQLVDGYYAGSLINGLLVSSVWMAALSLIGLLLLWSLAYLVSRTTVYTLTNKRIVMRVGIVLTMSFNLPLKTIVAADIRKGKKGFGDIPLTICADTKIAYVHLWPHARPFHLANPKPMLRCIDQVEHVSTLLSRAWCAEHQVELNQVQNVTKTNLGSFGSSNDSEIQQNQFQPGLGTL